MTDLSTPTTVREETNLRGTGETAERIAYDRAEYGDGQFETGFGGGNKAFWHGLGTIIPDDVVTKEAAQGLAGLNWTVERAEILARTIVTDPATGLDWEQPVEVPTHRALIRSTDQAPLGVVGKGYVPIQNADLFELGDAIVGTGEAKWHTAGSLRGGKTVWALARLDYQLLVGLDPDEVLNPFMLIANSHDGSGAFKVTTTTERVCCRNTLQWALRGAKLTWTMRHTKNVTLRADEAREAIGLAKAYFEEVDRVANRMIQEKIDRAAALRFFRRLVPYAPPTDNERGDKQRKANVDAIRAAIASLYDGSPNLQNVRGTAWGVLNAVTEYEDHYRPLAKSDEQASRRFERNVWEPGLKARAFEMLAPEAAAR